MPTSMCSTQVSVLGGPAGRWGHQGPAPSQPHKRCLPSLSLAELSDKWKVTHLKVRCSGGRGAPWEQAQSWGEASGSSLFPGLDSPWVTQRTPGGKEVPGRLERHASVLGAVWTPPAALWLFVRLMCPRLDSFDSHVAGGGWGGRGRTWLGSSMCSLQTLPPHTGAQESLPADVARLPQAQGRAWGDQGPAWSLGCAGRGRRKEP